ncbi:MAG: lipopolysaccharide heptosyltransferase II [Candidatus Omnitrophota bacterium]
MKKILVVNINWLGDSLFSTPAIRALKETIPKAQITCMTVPRCYEILQDNPHIDQLIVYDERGKHKSLLAKFGLIKQLRLDKFDEVYIFHRSFTRALIAYFAGIPVRVGYNTKGRGFLLTRALPFSGNALHRVEHFLNIVRAQGYDTADKDYEFFIPENAKDSVEGLLKKAGITNNDLIVVLNPGGNWPPKRWGKEKFAKLGDELVRRFKARIIISGAPKDLGLGAEIANLMEEKSLNLAGRTNLKQLAALMQQADYVISADSGPMHIALAVKRPKVIALFGPTSSKITGPYGAGNFAVIKKDVGCKVPCYKFDCRDYKCMGAISASDILEIVENDRKK